ncbi:hypothetical protein L0128_11650 [candidate division KSB1 bacterium]|nr:hypothetical protein [candidate division KSB1 bacterium]
MKISMLLLLILLFLWPGTGWSVVSDGGIHLLISVPMDEFAGVAKTGMGIGGKILANFESQPWLAIRGDLGYLSYDSKQRLINMGGYGVYESVRQEGFQLAIGPQLAFSHEPFRFYLSPLIGYQYFQTVISLPDYAYRYGIYAMETKDNYGAFGWSVGGGFMVDIGLGPYIDVGVKYDYLFDGVRKKVDSRTVKEDGYAISITLGVVFVKSH